MKRNNLKAWLYLLPAFLLLTAFMLYPLLDVIIYSFEENFAFVTQTYTGVGFEIINISLRILIFIVQLRIPVLY